MRIRRVGLDACRELGGAVVVVDVLRSFTTAAIGFAAGARTLYAADDPERARELAAAAPGAVTVGSRPGGAPIDGFDLPNSPARVAEGAIDGRDIVMSTAGGVRGLVASQRADLLLAGSLVCAGATAALLRRERPSEVAFVITGVWTDRDGDEDHACADLIEAMLFDPWVDPAPYEARVRASDFGRRFTGPPHADLPAADLECCARANRYGFAMRAQRHGAGVRLVPER